MWGLCEFTRFVCGMVDVYQIAAFPSLIKNSHAVMDIVKFDPGRERRCLG